LLVVLMLGPAGSGKSTLTAAYGEWLERIQGARVYRVNLDPAAEFIPYTPDYDVRKIVDARRVALEYGLGPNGALVKAMELLSENLRDPVEAIGSSGADYVLVDTPGQMEVFLFRDVSIRLVDALQEVGESVCGVFVLDATIIRDPADYAFQLLLAIAAQLRLNLDVAPVLNKVDLLGGSGVTGDLHTDYAWLSKALKRHRSLYAEMLHGLLKKLVFYAKKVNVPRVSASRGEGLEELHRLVLEMQCNCGDLS